MLNIHVHELSMVRRILSGPMWTYRNQRTSSIGRVLGTNWMRIGVYLGGNVHVRYVQCSCSLIELPAFYSKGVCENPRTHSGMQIV